MQWFNSQKRAGNEPYKGGSMGNSAVLLIGWVMGHLHVAEAVKALSPEHTSVTLYVSKLGDNSDGSSWQRAFHTIQKALEAIPDAEGNHRVIVRPDTYMEANLFPAHRGAPGAYNVLEADYDGRLGSGATGYAVIDSGDPDKGLKSVDWWGPFRCTADIPAIEWDRWTFRRLYCTGSEAGMGWDLTAALGAEFSVIVEDCFGIGRAFGGIVAGFVSRPKEPVVYRRCQLWSLDWWGDTAAMYVRSERPAMPAHPDVIIEDCVLVSPQCSLKAGNPGYSGYSRVALKNCRLITLNFSQPHGTPTPGIIQSVVDGKFLHVDLEDCTLMGYKVFGVREKIETERDIAYTAKGSVRAYVQFQQEVPAGFLRIGHWPPEVFASILPPTPPPCRPALVKEGPIRRDLCECTPIVWRDRLCLLECIRPASGGSVEDYYLILTDLESGERLARFGEGHSLACALVHRGTLYAFASRFESNDWNDVTLFRSRDLVHWDKRVVIEQEPGEHLFNSTVCAGPHGFVMAYETNDPKYPAFTIKFARSKDLKTWTKIPEAIFGADRYTACPCIRHVGGYYYILYTEHRKPRWFFETYLARSKDLVHWEVSAANAVLTPDREDECINTSDPDIIEWRGKTHLYYSVGDQRTWMNIKRATYPGPMRDFFEAYFPKR